MNIARERIKILLKGTNPVPAAAVVKKLGEPYNGIERPKGYRRQMRKGACFRNAAHAALHDRGIYVEGFACRIQAGLPGSFPVHHAWITKDGKTAIDQTWVGPDASSYFGIAFPTALLARTVGLRNWWGMLSERIVLDLLDHHEIAVGWQSGGNFPSDMQETLDLPD